MPQPYVQKFLLMHKHNLPVQKYTTQKCDMEFPASQSPFIPSP
jgi:hypothetical protein